MNSPALRLPALQLIICYLTFLFSGTRVVIELDKDNYTRVQVREEVNVKINCSYRRDQFILNRAIQDLTNVSIRWIYEQQTEALDGFRPPSIVPG